MNKQTKTEIGNSSLLKVKVGDQVKYHDRDEIGILRDIQLVPNGINDFSLVAILYVEFAEGRILSCTSDKFVVCENVLYDTFYRSGHLEKLSRPKKICSQKFNGSCQQPKLHCNYPDCEKYEDEK